MKKKQLSVILGAVMGLSVAAPAAVMAAGTEGAQSPGAMDQQAAGNQQPSSIMQMNVSDLKGQQLLNPAGESLGQIDDVVKDPQDDSLHAVVSVGGFMGIGQNQVTYPIENLHLRGDEIVASTEISRDELQQRSAYNADQYDPVTDDQQLAQAGGMAGADVQADIASFDELDANSDGVISQDEASNSDILSGQWQQYDANADQQLDQSEFSAFESDIQGQMPDTGAQPMDQGDATSDPQAMGQPPEGQPEQVASFDSLDADGDGYISQDEASASESLSGDWQQYDFNSDQQLDQSEFSAFESDVSGQPMGDGMGAQQDTETMGQSGQAPDQLSSFDNIDTDADGYISRDEAQTADPLVNAWQDVDVNSDDQIDQGEFSAFEAGWRAGKDAPGMQDGGGSDVPPASFE